MLSETQKKINSSYFGGFNVFFYYRIVTKPGADQY